MTDNPLSLTHPQNPYYARLTGYRWVPGNLTTQPTCGKSPVCRIHNKNPLFTRGPASAGFPFPAGDPTDVTSQWLNNGVSGISLPLDKTTW